MNWLEITNTIAQTLLPLALMAAAVTLLVYINKKKKQIQDTTDNELVDKYLDIVEDVITDAVLTTTQTYVESLKNKNMFDEEAQRIAFQQTYDAVMKVITEDMKKVLSTVVGDLETYITNKIEATVKVTKRM